MKILRDTGALQSLVSSNVLTNDDYVITGERRLIRGITGDVVSVPLVELTVECQLYILVWFSVHPACRYCSVGR